MYFNNSPHCLAETIREFPIVSLAAAPEIFKQVKSDIIAGYKDAAHPQLYEMYIKNYHKAIDTVIGKPTYNEKYYKLYEEFKLNTAKVAAFKAHDATNALKALHKADPAKFEENSTAILKTYNRYQATEYNTTTARCRTAKQFEKFASEKDLYPNIEWLATRSSTPRELHASFVGTVLPQDDPFWQENQPGNLYNCKCDWRTTDKAVSATPTKAVSPAQGLEGNPATTGQIFSDKHAYFNRAKSSFSKNEIANLFYKDNTGKFNISVIADKTEIADNIATGRILLQNFPKMDIKVMPHVTGAKNPEYLINNQIGDAKRIEKYSGINNGFQKAVNKQNCKVVVIDFNKHFNTNVQLGDRAIELCVGGITNRYRDFDNGVICYIIYGNKAGVINKENFAKHKIRKLIKELMP